jgi:hypothetical protein
MNAARRRQPTATYQIGLFADRQRSAARPTKWRRSVPPSKAWPTRPRPSLQSLSGVNLDEEAANLLRYQQAYQAAAKVLEIASKMFDEILALGPISQGRTGGKRMRSQQLE